VVGIFLIVHEFIILSPICQDTFFWSGIMFVCGFNPEKSVIRLQSAQSALDLAGLLAITDQPVKLVGKLTKAPYGG
jgi:hypothetical protein